jgi:hypothetical protein
VNTQLAAFAVTNKAHIAVVESDRARRDYSFRVTEQQLESVIEKASSLEYKIKLISGTFIYFISATDFEKMRGLRLDRIQTTISAIYKMPEYFLESRLAPGVTVEEGIVLSTGE